MSSGAPKSTSASEPRGSRRLTPERPPWSLVTHPSDVVDELGRWHDPTRRDHAKPAGARDGGGEPPGRDEAHTSLKDRHLEPERTAQRIGGGRHAQPAPPSASSADSGSLKSFSAFVL